jgi:4-diphosphocytidyl-2-C-methyl-D-erythritol kinase
MIRFPNCKINIGLYVTGKREDGYHNLETVFYPLPFRDVLEIVPATAPALHLSGHQVAGSTDNNLIWKAFELLQQKFPERVPTLDIYLHKVIPMGAGLGGGSADGAVMLDMLNEYCDLGLSRAQLASMALQLGSDCPFFIYNTPQFAMGRGEQMEGIALDLSGHSIQLICPKVHVSTAMAFSMLKLKPASFDLRKLPELDISEWKDHITNDFELPVFHQHPALSVIKKQLYEQGAIYASMSGSGSAIFGIFPRGKQARIEAGIDFEAHYFDIV